MILQIKKENKGMYIQYDGIVTGVDIMESNGYFSKNKIRGFNYFIHDLTFAAMVDVSIGSLRIKVAINKNAARANKDLCQIFVCCNKDVKQLIEDYKELMSTGMNRWEIVIVDTLEEAIKIASERVVRSMGVQC